MNRLNEKYNASDKEIWVTEQGATTSLVTERQQAQYVPRAYGVEKSYGVDKAIWYDFMDDGTDPNLSENNFGFVRNEKSTMGAYTPKAAYVTYAAMTRMLTGARYISGGITADKIYNYKFKAENGDNIMMLWSLVPQEIKINTKSDIEVTDVVGKTVRMTPVHDSIYLTRF